MRRRSCLLGQRYIPRRRRMPLALEAAPASARRPTSGSVFSCGYRFNSPRTRFGAGEPAYEKAKAIQRDRQIDLTVRYRMEGEFAEFVCIRCCPVGTLFDENADAGERAQF